MAEPKYHSDTWREHDDVDIRAKRVKLYAYDSTNTTWRAVRCNANGEFITGSDLVQETLAFYMSGDAIVNNLVIDGHYFKEDKKITKIGIFCDKSPTGADLIIDQTVGGVAQSKVATVSAGSQYEETDVADMVVLTTDRYGLKVTQIGSTNPGTNIKVVIHFEKV